MCWLCLHLFSHAFKKNNRPCSAQYAILLTTRYQNYSTWKNQRTTKHISRDSAKRLILSLIILYEEEQEQTTFPSEKKASYYCWNQDSSFCSIIYIEASLRLHVHWQVLIGKSRWMMPTKITHGISLRSLTAHKTPNKQFSYLLFNLRV